MATVATSPAPKKRLGWLRLLGWIFGILILLLVVTYFVVTSSAFFKGFILPRASKALNADITVSDASISPFSQVVLRNLKVQTAGSEPLVSATEARLRYSLTAIMGGNIQVDEVALVSPTIVLVANPDGTSNLDPLLKASQKPEAAKPAETKPAAPEAKNAKPLQIDVKKVTLSDATLRNEKHYAGGSKDVAEISQLNISVENVKNGQTGKITISSAVAVNNNPPAPAKGGSLAAKINGAYDFSLTPDLKPAGAKGNLRLEVTSAQGLFAQLASFATELNCEVTPSEIKQLALQFKQGANSLGQLAVSGPFDMQKLEGRLSVQVANIDKNLLNMATAGTGMDFGSTAINSTNEIVLAKSGSQITATGQLNLQDLQINRPGQTMPALGLQAVYGVFVDRAASNIVLNTFTLNGTQSGKAVLQGGLSSPMNISGGSAAGDSKLNLAINHLNLADWRSMAGDTSLAGDVSFALQVLSQQSGKQNNVDLSSQISNLTAAAGKVQISQLSLKSQISHSTPDFKQQNIKGTFALSDFTGQFGSNSLSKFGVSVNLDVASSPTQIQLNKISGQLAEAGQAGGSFDLTGAFNLTNKATQITAKLANINENLLRPFLEPALSGKKLGSVAINANIDASYDPQAPSAFKGGLDIANLVINDPKQRIPATPLAVSFQIDGSINKQVLDLKNLQLALTPTAQGSNVIQLSGQVDMSKTNVEGNLKLAAASIDVTRYYDLFMPTNSAKPQAMAAAAPAPASSSAPASTNASAGLAAMHFPVRNFTASVDIGRFILREVDIAGLQATAKIDDGHIVVNPFKLTLNGSPISSTLDVDLGVPGFKYDVTFNAAPISLTPFIDSFQPERKGTIAGSFSAQAKLTGAGIPGPGSQATSAFNGGFMITNLVIKDPTQKLPATPLAAAFQFDGALDKQVLNLKNFQVALTPTARGTNVIQLSGQVDMSKPNVEGTLKLAADSIDVTSYMDMFMPSNAPAKTASAAPAAKSAPAATPAPAANPNQEPAAMHFPVRNFTAAVDIKRFYLREIDIAGLQATTKIDDAHIVVNPFQLTLNGAPVSATVDADLGVPGFKYDVALNATSVPLPPFVDSFAPQNKGMVGGTISAQAKVTGAGITGASLQTNLVGQFNINTTNLNLSATNMPTKTLKVLVGAVAQVPGLVANAGGTGLGLLQNAIGLGSSTNVDMTKSAVEVIATKGTMGSGKIEISQLLIQSPAFQAQAPGTITLAAVLTNSTLNIPASVALERSVAQKCYLATANDTNAYSQLPPFLTVTGTVGNPQKHLETTALLKFALQQATSQGAAGKGSTGQILQGVSGLFGSSTNSSGTNTTSKAGSILNNFLGGSSSSTNSATNNQAPVKNLLKGFLK